MISENNKDYWLIEKKNLEAWATGSSMWTYGMNYSCCGREFSAALGPRYDWSRFGAMPVSDPRNADLLIVSGTVNEQLGKELVEVYEKMLAPKFLIAIGSCAISGGLFQGENEYGIKRVEDYLPVDIFVPGCPPRPEAILHGLLTLQKRIDSAGKKLND